MSLIPNRPVPALTVPTLAGESFDLARRRPRSFTQLVFYRGLHCPICKAYLRGLESRLSEFEERGVETIAISTDPRNRAAEAAGAWGLERLAIGYGLAIETARSWGLYISAAIRGGRAGPIRRTGAVPSPPGRAALLGRGADHALHQAVRLRRSAGDRLHPGEELSRARRGVTQSPPCRRASRHERDPGAVPQMDMGQCPDSKETAAIPLAIADSLMLMADII